MPIHLAAATPTTRRHVKPVRPRLGNTWQDPSWTWQDPSWRTAYWMTPVLRAPFAAHGKATKLRRKLKLRTSTVS